MEGVELILELIAAFTRRGELLQLLKMVSSITIQAEEMVRLRVEISSSIRWRRVFFLNDYTRMTDRCFDCYCGTWHIDNFSQICYV